MIARIVSGGAILNVVLVASYLWATPVLAVACHAVCPKAGGVTCACTGAGAGCYSEDTVGCSAWNDTNCSVENWCPAP